MKNLDDIPKKEIFNVPEGYFEELPGMIQSRVTSVAEKRALPGYATVIRYAMAMSVIVVAAFLWMQRSLPNTSAESMLASIETPDLVAYLNDDADLSTDDLLDDLRLHPEDADMIGDAVYGIDLGIGDVETIYDELD